MHTMVVMGEYSEEDFPWSQKTWRNYKIPIILGSVSLFSIVISLILLVKSTQITTPIRFISNQATSSASNTDSITIDIEGGVVNPGLYKLPAGSRVEDAMQRAGGLSDDADSEKIATTINKAAILKDGMKLYIPGRSDSLNNTSHNPESLLQRPGAGASQNDSNYLTQNETDTISVNFASQFELESLPGIGPVTANKIIAGRPYQNLEDLVAKKAMSQSLLEKLRDRLSL